MRTIISTAVLTFLASAAPIQAQVSAAIPTAANTAQSAVISNDRAAVDLLKMGLRSLEPSHARRFIQLPVDQVFFPGDSDEFVEKQRYDRPGYNALGDFPREAADIEQWYLQQIPGAYEDVPRPNNSLIWVLYLPGCASNSGIEVAKLFPDETVGGDDFRPWHFDQANAELAIEALTGQPVRPEYGLDAPDDGGGWSDNNIWSNARIRAINRAILRASHTPEVFTSSQIGPGQFLILRGICEFALQRKNQATFPGMLTPPGPPPPPPSMGIQRYYRLPWPIGASNMLIGTSMQRRRCVSQRGLPLNDPRCGLRGVTNDSEIRFDIPGRHAYSAKFGANWRTGTYVVASGHTYEERHYSELVGRPPLISDP